MKIRLTLLVAIAAVALTGCGGSDGSSNPLSGPSDEDQVRELTATAADYLRDKEYGNYCDLLSPAAIEELENTEGLVDTSCEGLLALFGGVLSDQDLETIGKPTAIEIAGDEAMVTFDDDEFDLTAEKVDGEWMIGPDGEESPGSSSEPEITPELVKGWMASWCDVDVGMSRREVVAIMGEPTGSFDGSSGETPQVNYDGFGSSFTAFFNIDGAVKQLDAAVESGSDLKCAASRGS